MPTFNQLVRKGREVLVSFCGKGTGNLHAIFGLQRLA